MYFEIKYPRVMKGRRTYAHWPIMAFSAPSVRWHVSMYVGTPRKQTHIFARSHHKNSNLSWLSHVWPVAWNVLMMRRSASTMIAALVGILSLVTCCSSDTKLRGSYDDLGRSEITVHTSGKRLRGRKSYGNPRQSKREEQGDPPRLRGGDGHGWHGALMVHSTTSGLEEVRSYLTYRLRSSWIILWNPKLVQAIKFLFYQSLVDWLEPMRYLYMSATYCGARANAQAMCVPLLHLHTAAVGFK